MSATGAAPTASQRALLERARAGDEDAYGSLVEPHRNELRAHCYRMLGSIHDAEDALQDALLRAWRGLGRFDGRGALRPWLYKIATNTSLDVIARRSKRVLPMDFGPAADPQLMPGAPVAETVWVEPFPDDRLGIEDGRAAPDARYELRESVELAFIAALQHLPATQRAVLILREVLGYSAKECAELLATSVASINSALQRARAAIAERVPEHSQQATLRALGDDAVRDTVDRYVHAWETCDVEAFVAMLTEDATFAMPPLSSWYAGRESITTWARVSSMSGDWHWRALSVRANGQPALGFYAWDPDARTYVAFALNVLTFRGPLIENVTAFIVRSTERSDEEIDGRWPEEPPDDALLATAFERFGLPARLDGPPPARGTGPTS